MDTLTKFVRGSWGIVLNANDFFGFACADAVTVHPLDLEWVLPMYEKYDQVGIDACMSYIAKQKPIQPWITDKFNEAYAEIEKLNPKVWSEY